MRKMLNNRSNQYRPDRFASGFMLVTLLTSLLVLSGCEQSMTISDEELVLRMEECSDESKLTPGMAVACGNYQKECKRRGKANGNYFC